MLALRVVLFADFSRRSLFPRGRRAFSRWNAPVPLFTIGLFILVAACALPARADSVAVGYTSTDLGGGTWEYAYTLSGSLSANDDLAIYFPLATSSNLNDLGTGGSDFTTFVLQPDPNLPAPGEYDITANLDDPSLAPTFDVTFTSIGAAVPGSQDFVLYDPDWNILESGTTTLASGSVTPVAATPEPASLLLFGSGIVAIYTLYVRRRRTS